VANRRLSLASNAPGDIFVDDSCIDCGACRWIAPDNFDAHGGYARVHRQPGDDAELRQSLRAAISCPTGSIGSESRAELKRVAGSFPVPWGEGGDGVHHCGYHHRDSFGAASYLIVRPAGNVLIDSPRFHRGLVRRIEQLGGVATMFLTHRDDVAEHERFRRHFDCERVMHADDLRPSTRGVERVIEGIEPLALDAELTVIPTPGHTPGSACLVYRERYLFSGDHLAFGRAQGHPYAFRGACWYDWGVQIESMRRLARQRFEHVLPGHGAPFSYPAERMPDAMRRCIDWMQRA
jgi:glyoxylase-like metal-dependent hydrolase (beta-lactamase superfamily II)/ferredoxin